MGVAVEFENVFQHVNGRCVLKGLSFCIDTGESFALLGPNGAGKTILLRLIMGLDRPSAGRISVCGQNYDALSAAELSKFRYSLGMVLQGGALLNGLSVAENIILPLRETRQRVDLMWRKARLIMTQLRLDGLENLSPHELSGGLQRKVELARALIQQPKLLMWDELLDGLDPASVIEIADHLAREKRTRDMTLIFTTHQTIGALSIANRVGVLDNGELLFDGAADDLSGIEDDNPDLKYVLKGWI